MVRAILTCLVVVVLATAAPACKSKEEPTTEGAPAAAKQAPAEPAPAPVAPET